MNRPRPRRRHDWLVVLVVGALAATVPTAGSSLATLSGATVTGGSVSVASDWSSPTVAAQVAALASDTRTGGVLRRGSRYYVYANVRPQGTGAPAIVSVTADVSAVSSGQSAAVLSAGTFSFPSTSGTTYGYRSALLTVGSSIAAGDYAWTITTVDELGNRAVNSFTLTVSTTYVFMSSADHGSTNCRSNTVGRFDMELGYVPSGAERSQTGTGNAERLTFCSDSFSVGATIPSGTTVVTFTYENLHTTRSCDLTVTLLRNSSSLGSRRRTISANTARTTGTWEFSTSNTTFAAGDRLNVSVDFQSGRCQQASVVWNNTTNPSKVVTP